MKALGEGVWITKTKKKRRNGLAVQCAMGSKLTLFIVLNSEILPKSQSVKWMKSFTGKIRVFIKKPETKKKLLCH